MKAFITMLRQNKFLSFVNIATTVVFSILLLTMTIILNQSNIEIKASRNFEDKHLYKLSDTLLNEKEAEFLSKKDNFTTLNHFANDLLTTAKFTYYSAIWQPIEVADFKGDQIFDPYYEFNQEQPPVVIKNRIYKSVKSMQVNENVLKLNNIQIRNGKTFDSNDFNYDEKKQTIPLILGYEYSKYYKVGDIVDIYYYAKPFKGIIVGIIDSSQKIMTYSEPEVVLDRYILLPIMKFTDRQVLASLNDIFTRASLLSRINGIVISDLSPLEIRSTLNDISSTHNFRDFDVIGANSLGINTVVKMTQIHTSNLLIFIISVLIITTLIFILTLILTIKNNLETYTVLLISGLSINKIKNFISLKVLINILLGLIFSSLSFFIVLGDLIRLLPIFVAINLSWVVIVLIVINMACSKIMERFDIIQKLKG